MNVIRLLLAVAILPLILVLIPLAWVAGFWWRAISSFAVDAFLEGQKECLLP